jgi:hypothetical protein
MHRPLATAVLAGVLLSGCAGQATPEKDTGDGRLALVSGRDDHGLVQTDEVPVHSDTTYGHVVGTIHDGTLVRVVERDGMAMRVSTVEGPTESGWLDDFHLRGQVRLVGPAPSCAVNVAGTDVLGGTLALVYAVKGSRVLVETQPPAGGESRRGWVRRDVVQELPPQGKRCGEDPPGSKHAH